MTSLIAKYVAKKIFSETTANSQGTEDPYFEYVPTKKLSSFHGKPKTKRVKKALPPGLSPADEKVLVKVKRRAYRLDMALGSFLGFKIGVGSLIAILPVVGDFADLLLALLVIRTASAANLPHVVLLRMIFNVMFDFVLGLVPFVGDLADMAYKANTRNAIVLEDHLRERGKKNLEREGKSGVEDLSLGEVDVERGTTADEAAGVRHGRRREHDLEAQTGGESHGRRKEHDHEARTGGGSSAAGGRAAGSKSKKPKEKKKGSPRGHARLFSQETGTTRH